MNENSDQERVAKEGIGVGRESDSTIKQGVELVVMAEEMPKWKALKVSFISIYLSMDLSIYYNSYKKCLNRRILHV